jgi:hypothetical protein
MRTLQSLLKTIFNKDVVRKRATTSKEVYNKGKAKNLQAPYRIIKRKYSGFYGGNPNRGGPNNIPSVLFILLVGSFTYSRKN